MFFFFFFCLYRGAYVACITVSVLNAFLLHTNFGPLACDPTKAGNKLVKIGYRFYQRISNTRMWTGARYSESGHNYR